MLLAGNGHSKPDEVLGAGREATTGPWQDSNLQSLVPRTNALSIRPQGHLEPAGPSAKKQGHAAVALHVPCGCSERDRAWLTSWDGHDTDARAPGAPRASNPAHGLLFAGDFYVDFGIGPCEWWLMWQPTDTSCPIESPGTGTGGHLDPGRTRTCNLWFRGPTPYPLGHRTTRWFNQPLAK